MATVRRLPRRTLLAMEGDLPTDVVIRSATDDDIGAIRGVGAATWPTTYGFAGSEYVEHGLATWWSREAVATSLEVTNTYVAQDGDVIVGMGNIDLRQELPTIWKLYVLPGHQGRRIGHQLLTRLIQDTPPDADGVVLSYIDGNEAAARFYRRHGFRELRREVSQSPGWPAEVWMIRPRR
ncbi:ribosomal protein S18 acetylase RimI-like enzyme [Branchiibius hedensis]|uniref:Ribosomal protein S18 acetylase RimI n=1 Tax=Branchiibius hedensis TaxID=672460 RepID=A0A2Y8ZTT8_9MICO|nr:GNAT family N-acetyltransferase [Branchiibius hedensis]PWJ24873.1 ribosomal protein S18 acetylase RimI-like enzyme [Branchiibius hedensis]SSA33689.1 Ribosomal protein S18 acetylase RimI [Branchiibius hedensis]